jgi:glycosylphosphatidylinositol deacylase
MRIFTLIANREERKTSKRWIASILLVVLLVATIIPFQVALMIVFLIQFSLCSMPEPQLQPSSNSKEERREPGSSPTPEQFRQQDNKQVANFHILILLTWLLPFAAPILVVWIRTLQTAGYTVPFNGDHNIFIILPWLLLGEATASGRNFLREKSRWRQKVTYALIFSISLTCLLVGARYPFLVFEMATITVSWLVLTRVKWRSAP